MSVLSPQGKFFYITPGICPSLSTMRAIVESAGGKLLSRQPSFRKIMEHKQNKVLPLVPLIPFHTLCKKLLMKNVRLFSFVTEPTGNHPHLM